MRCSCCGYEIPYIPKGVNLSPYERRILDIIVASREPVSVTKIINELYAHDPSGGPENAELTIRQLVSRIRIKLKETSVELINTWGQGYNLKERPNANRKLHNSSNRLDLRQSGKAPAERAGRY